MQVEVNFLSAPLELLAGEGIEGGKLGARRSMGGNRPSSPCDLPVALGQLLSNVVSVPRVGHLSTQPRATIGILTGHNSGLFSNMVTIRADH
ncbi:hypothetical protein Pcinc_011755 [Petrolisthes cinctipes]|uniref:Uncharacterized protein n=1 Tax=Petrolisthes cinctipes TaxID=88211 RepID=A0AAE1KU48_PETCI|nr:hypothetical protein Pcinc_011755 [Petrolisthes cinctipes]